MHVHLLPNDIRKTTPEGRGKNQQGARNFYHDEKGKRHASSMLELWEDGGLQGA